jgi:hypothetical protein
MPETLLRHHTSGIPPYLFVLNSYAYHIRVPTIEPRRCTIQQGSHIIARILSYMALQLTRSKGKSTIATLFTKIDEDTKPQARTYGVRSQSEERHHIEEHTTARQLGKDVSQKTCTMNICERSYSTRLPLQNAMSRAFRLGSRGKC